MPLKISKAMRSKLPEAVRGNIEQLLWDKSGGRCFLCEEPLNRSADAYEADHDIPESLGGETDVDNLNLAHESCNRAKRSAKSVPIRPYLKLAAYARRKGGRLKYDGYLDHFGINARDTVITLTDGAVTLELPDGSLRTVPVMSEINRAGTFSYAFVQLPRDAIHNDDACQPRALRPEHAWGIYSDLQQNALHEPPSCRLSSDPSAGPLRLLMFDGQHKTVATWMLGRQEVTCKLYLNLTTPQAVQLVNSIQAKIKKLPLSPFELAGKMSDEWENKFAQYEDAVGSAAVSEDGFLSWVPTTEKARAKQALQSALLQSVLASPELRITSHVRRAGAPAPGVTFTEQTLKSKVIEKLLCMEALKSTGEEAQAIRDLEASNIIEILNQLNDQAFEPVEDASELGPVELERARRITYQSSLAYISGLLHQLWNHVTMTTGSKEPMAKQLNDTQSQQIRVGVKRLVDHPCWTAEFDRDPQMVKLKVALEKNQEVKQALEGVGLNLAYLIIGNQDSTFAKQWLTPA